MRKGISLSLGGEGRVRGKSNRVHKHVEPSPFKGGG